MQCADVHQISSYRRSATAEFQWDIAVFNKLPKCCSLSDFDISVLLWCPLVEIIDTGVSRNELQVGTELEKGAFQFFITVFAPLFTQLNS